MSHILKVPFSQGYVSTGSEAQDAGNLESGELVKMSGAFYRKNDPHQVWKMPGRSLFSDYAAATDIRGIAICQFDSGGTDKLVVLARTPGSACSLLSAIPGYTGTFSVLRASLNSSSNRLTAANQNDRWYLGNGYDKNLCLQPDGTVRNMGMEKPGRQLTVTPSTTSGAINYPTESTGDFINPTRAYDADSSSASTTTLSSAGVSTHIWKTWGTNTNASRSLSVDWSVSGDFQSSSDREVNTSKVGTGGTTSSGSKILVRIYVSVDAGVTWPSATVAKYYTKAATGTISVPISDAVNSNLVQVKVEVTYQYGTVSATVAIREIRIKWGSLTVNFTAPNIYYAYTELNEPEETESAPSALTKTSLTNQNQVLLTRPTAVNSSATHWKIYRGVSGGVEDWSSLGLVDRGKVPISSTTFVDSFETDHDIQLLELVRALTIGDLSRPMDFPPPTCVSMVSWKGSICGISRETSLTRTFRYSEAGSPESWPEFYVVSAFPLEEHDDLVGQMPVGETLVLLCRGAVLALDDLPRVVDGQFNGANARALKGHPGCVGNYAYTTFSVAGEPRGAWVSPFGVYVTNGTICACISLDLAWEREVDVPSLSSSVLRWDAKNLILWFDFDSDGDGVNDREMPFHMAQVHSKGESRPKLGQPTAKATSCMASALIDSAFYRYSGDPSDGKVYVEESGYVDAATSQNVVMSVQTGLISSDKVDIGIIKGTVNHSNFGLGETATLTTTLIRDSAKSENSKTNTVDLYGDRGTTVGIGRAGELVQFQVDYSGSGSGGISGIDLEVEGTGRSGSAARWVSTSATP